MRRVTILVAASLAVFATVSASAEDDDWGGLLQATSGQVCGLRLARSGLEKSVADEKRYATQAGVLNLGRLEFLKQHMRAIDHAIAEDKKQLADVKLKVLPCNSTSGQGIVRKLSRCIPAGAQLDDGEVIQWDAPGSDEECEDPDVVSMMATFFPDY